MPRLLPVFLLVSLPPDTSQKDFLLLNQRFACLLWVLGTSGCARPGQARTPQEGTPHPHHTEGVSRTLSSQLPPPQPSSGTGNPKPRDHEIIQVGGDPGRSPVQLSAPAVSGQLARGCVPPALGHVPGRRSQSLQGEVTHCLLSPAANPLL